MRRSALGVTLLVFLALPAMAVTPATAAPTHEETVIAVQIQENGDAVWTVSARYALDDENDTAAFERLRAEYEAGGSTAGFSADLFRNAADRVARETGREMTITGVSRESELEASNGSQVGELRLTFTWTDFATVTEENVSVQSAFQGGWFGDLSTEQTLRIIPPSGYRVQSASPSTDVIGGALQWEGPQSFDEGEPSVSFAALGTGTTPTTPPTEGISWPTVAIGFALIAVAALILLAWRGGYLGGRGSEDGSEEPPAGGGVESEPQSVMAPDAASGSESGPGPDPTAGDEPAGTDVGSEAGAGVVDADLLSDEERIEHLLEEHGGRMKQAKIVEETRWSNAKVSQLLSAMAEDERVEKLRIGRENLISLPGHEEES